MNASTVIKLICARNGAMNYDELVSYFAYDEFFGSTDSVIQNNDIFSVVYLNGEKTVVVKTTLKICRAQTCNGCKNLHLCKFFILGDCQYGKGRRGCRFSHDLTSAQNISVLRQHNLQCLDKRELCILLLQSDSALLPPVCYSYNNGTGDYGKCQDGEACTRLHICEQYLRGTCLCSRAHDFYEPHPLKTLKDRGVPNELLGSMKTVYTNIEALRDLDKTRRPKSTGGAMANASASASANGVKNPNKYQRKDRAGQNSGPVREKTEICMYFVKGSCKHGDACRREHSQLPYKWEVRNGQAWDALPGNEDIEKDYCNPAKTYSSGHEPVCFDTMTCGLRKARRLSTVSSVLQPTFMLTTQWAWYWEDEHGRWIQYATPSGGHGAASVSNDDLEQKYQEDPNRVLEFTAGSQMYELHFQDMIQRNKQYGTKKLVRRRPVFVSSADAQTIRTRKIFPINRMNFKALPSTWDKSQAPETGFKKVSLESSSSEYKEVLGLFSATVRGVSILSIHRIQNKALWEVFQWQRDLMRKNNAGRNVTERQLFHGTDAKHIDAICLNNFDWRICGTHGTAYGRGSYFARDAKYSHSYTGQSATKCLFVCRVLVGDYTIGDSSYQRPPSKDGGDTIFYDSCVNDVHNPSIYVVFEKHQIYPEYLIQYCDSGSTPPTSSYNMPRTASAYRPAPTPTHTPAPVYRPAPAQSPSAYRPAPTPTYTPAPVYRPAQSHIAAASSSSSSNRSYPPPKAKSDNSCAIS